MKRLWHSSVAAGARRSFIWFGFGSAPGLDRRSVSTPLEFVVASHPFVRKSAELPMRSEQSHTQATLAQLVAKGADAGQIADVAIAIWLDSVAVLSPIIGERGFAALYKRSLFLARRDYPWMATVHEGVVLPAEFAELRVALAQQTSATAVAANGALLQTFHDLLTNLIGGPLTERLLRSVWDRPSTGHAAEGISL